MKLIKLSHGKFSLIDDADFLELSKYHWHFDGAGGGYARTVINKKTVFMHRLILNPSPGFECDHANGNGIDNRRINLRLCTKAQNQYNAKIRSDNTSGFRGVCWNKKSHKWEARIQSDSKMIFLGLFTDPIEAAKVRDIYARELHGNFARTNFPNSWVNLAVSVTEKL